MGKRPPMLLRQLPSHPTQRFHSTGSRLPGQSIPYPLLAANRYKWLCAVTLLPKGPAFSAVPSKPFPLFPSLLVSAEISALSAEPSWIGDFHVFSADL